MANELAEQAARLYRIATEFVMKFQFRNRNEMLCHGLTVVQCYTIEALEDGPLSMSDLSARLRVPVSTMTRIIDRLVEKSLVVRHNTPEDRRVWEVSLSLAGRALLQTIQADLIARNQELLATIPESSREDVLKAVAGLSHLVDHWRAQPRASSDSERSGL